MNIRIAPLPTTFVDRVRREGIDDLGQPVKRVIAQGGEPCRDVLRRANAGEELLLASFSPFSKSNPYKEYGPIFVLANPSEEDVQRDAFPVAGNDSDYLNHRFVIRAYSAEQEIVDAALIEAGEEQATIERLFSRPDAAYLHVRFPAYGCFACRVDRADV